MLSIQRYLFIVQLFCSSSFSYVGKVMETLYDKGSYCFETGEYSCVGVFFTSIITYNEYAELTLDKKLLIAVYIIALLLLSIAFIIFITRHKIKKQKETDLKHFIQKEKKFEAVMAAEEKEKTRIAANLHDGIGQTLSATKINLSVLQREIQFANSEQIHAFEKIVGLVDESCREVRSVSHKMVPSTLLRFGLASAIKNFISQIDSRVVKVDFYIEDLQQSLETNKEVIVYRVIQEAVNNVIKHAQASQLSISIIQDEEGISITIEDNGKGFNTQLQTNIGMGLENIKSRIAYLNGTVEWDSTLGKGTVVIINIPHTASR